MTRSQEQSIKERIRALSKERDLTFAELWQNLITETGSNGVRPDTMTFVYCHRFSWTLICDIMIKQNQGETRYGKFVFKKIGGDTSNITTSRIVWWI